jgi:ABC-type uncharacterized transport system permease subunit
VSEASATFVLQKERLFASILAGILLGGLCSLLWGIHFIFIKGSAAINDYGDNMIE